MDRRLHGTLVMSVIGAGLSVLDSCLSASDVCTRSVGIRVCLPVGGSAQRDDAPSFWCYSATCLSVVCPSVISSGCRCSALSFASC